MKDIQGYIKLNRSILNWQWYDKPNVRAVYFHLLLTAQYSDHEWQGVKLKCGQTICSYNGLSKALGISVQEVRTAIKHLEESKEITLRATNRFSIVTIEKWDIFTNNTNSSTNESTFNQHSANTQSAFNQQRYNKYNKNNKYNNNNCDGKPSYDVEEFEKRAIPLPVYEKGATNRI